MSFRFTAPSFLTGRRAALKLAVPPHQPSFQTRDVDEFIVIYDGPRALAMLNR